MSKDSDTQETEFKNNFDFEIPNSIRWAVSIPLLLLALFIVGIYCYLLFYNPKHIDSEKFGLSTTLLFTIVTLIIINIPWNSMGLRIKKIGIIELENVVKKPS